MTVTKIYSYHDQRFKSQ